MRLLIVDDHEVVRRGIRSLLTNHNRWEVCGEAVDGQDAVDKARELKPDLIIMDVSMPRLNGLEATPIIRSVLPDCEVLILSQHESPQMIQQALKAGARGYVVKSSVARDLLVALETVIRHEPFFDQTIRGMIQRSSAVDEQKNFPHANDTPVTTNSYEAGCRASAEKVNILMVDDEPGKLLTYEAILTQLGENLIKAHSAPEALEHLLKTDIAIVLMFAIGIDSSLLTVEPCSCFIEFGS